METEIKKILDWIRQRQTQPGGTENPEGFTEMHSYHVWEVLNAIRHMGGSAYVENIILKQAERRGAEQEAREWLDIAIRHAGDAQ